MAFFHFFSQSAITLLVLTPTIVSVLGADTGWLRDAKYNVELLTDVSTVRRTPPNVEEVGNGVNLLLGKPANEATRNPSFQFGEPKDGHDMYIKQEGMTSISKGYGCKTHIEEKKNYWSSSSSTMESAYSGYSAGFEQAINVGVNLPVAPNIEASVETELRTAFSFSRSKETSAVETKASMGLTSSSIVDSRSKLYSVKVDFKNVVWGSYFLEEISNLTEDNILSFFFKYGTHLFKEAEFGYTCHQDIFFESGHESSSYSDFLKKGSSENFAAKGFTYEDLKNTVNGGSGTADEGFEFYVGSMQCDGNSKTHSCGLMNKNPDVVEDDPVIVGWEVIPMWKVDIPGLTNEAKAIMRSKFEAVMAEYIKCAERNCNGRGGCKTSKGLNEQVPIERFYDRAGSCICVGDNQGAKCNEPPPSKFRDSFKVARTNSGTTKINTPYFTHHSSGGISKVYSEHIDQYEDRTFQFTNVSFENPGYIVHKFESGWSVYGTKGKGNIDFNCGDDHMVTGIESRHYNGWQQDRKFNLECSRYQNYKWEDASLCKATKRNVIELVLDAKCSDFGHNYVMVGMKSSHLNGYDDRWFEFMCCPLKRILPKRPAKTLT